MSVKSSLKAILRKYNRKQSETLCLSQKRANESSFSQEIEKFPAESHLLDHLLRALIQVQMATQVLAQEDSLNEPREDNLVKVVTQALKATNQTDEEDHRKELEMTQ